MDRISGLDVRPTSEYPAKNSTVIRPVALSPDNNTFYIRPDTNIRPDNQVGIKQLYYTEYPASFGAMTDTRPGRTQNLYATVYRISGPFLVTGKSIMSRFTDRPKNK